MNIPYHIQQGWHQLPISLGAFGGRRNIPEFTNALNQQAEDQFPYQHSDRGEWSFDGSKDVDLRKVGTLSNEKLHLQRAKAFNEALDKINQKLFNISKSHTPIGPGNFEATKYDTILCTGKFGKRDIALYPVEMQATVEIPREGKYTLKINFDNPKIEEGLQGPHGPHVGYDVIRHNKQATPGVTGHILINKNERLPDRGRSRYSIDDGSIARIPTTRVFFPPNRPNTFLERAEVTNQAQINKDETRGRSYPSPHF